MRGCDINACHSPALYYNSALFGEHLNFGSGAIVLTVL